MVVAKAILDEEHNVLLAADPSDTNSYLLGRIGSHNVVLACLPSGKLGTGLAALVVKDMLRSFEYIRFGLMVGIGGGVPNANMEDPDIRLGDYRWLFGPLATYRFFPHPKIVFATTRLDYLKSSCICSLPLEDIINLVASRSDYIVVL
jgi:hypothetical protein